MNTCNLEQFVVALNMETAKEGLLVAPSESFMCNENL